MPITDTKGQELYEIVAETFPDGKAAHIEWENLDDFERNGWLSIARQFIEQHERFSK